MKKYSKLNIEVQSKSTQKVLSRHELTVKYQDYESAIDSIMRRLPYYMARRSDLIFKIEVLKNF